MVMSSAPQQEQETVDEPAVRGFLADTASAVKAMKASWLRVALNLKRIRDEELWNYATPACENFEDYAFGVLKLNKYVARRMLKAMDYTSSKRPDMVDDVSGKLERGEEVGPAADHDRDQKVADTDRRLSAKLQASGVEKARASDHGQPA